MPRTSKTEPNTIELKGAKASNMKASQGADDENKASEGTGTVDMLDSLKDNFKDDKSPLPVVKDIKLVDLGNKYRRENLKEIAKFRIDPSKTDKENLILVQDKIVAQEVSIGELKMIVSQLTDLLEKRTKGYNQTIDNLRRELKTYIADRDELRTHLKETKEQLAKQNKQLEEKQDWLDGYNDENEGTMESNECDLEGNKGAIKDTISKFDQNDKSSKMRDNNFERKETDREIKLDGSGHLRRDFTNDSK